MPLKFRLKGLAETFVDTVVCPSCRHSGGEAGDQGFITDLSKVTYDGIIAVIQCECCKHIFVPENQRQGIVSSSKLRSAISKDSKNTGQPVFESIKDVRLEVERLNAHREKRVH